MPGLKPKIVMEELPESYNEWLFTSLEKWRNGPKGPGVATAHHDFKLWIRKTVEGWQSQCKAVDDLSKTTSALTERFDSGIANAIIADLERATFGSSPQHFMERTTIFLRAAFYDVEDMVKGYKESAEYRSERLNHHTEKLKALLKTKRELSMVKNDDDMGYFNGDLQLLGALRLMKRCKDPDTGEAYEEGVIIGHVTLTMGDVPELNEILESLHLSEVKQYAIKKADDIMLEALEETLEPVMKLWLDSASKAESIVKSGNLSGANFSEWSTKALELLLKDDGFFNSRSKEHQLASSRDLARFLAKNAERCRTIEEEGYDPEDFTLKKWLIRWFEVMTYDADLHAAYAKGMNLNSSIDSGSPWVVYQGLVAHAKEMTNISEKLGKSNATSEISKIQFGQIYDKMSNWLDEYWGLLQETANSMRSKPGFREKWAKFTNAPRRAFLGYETLEGALIDYNEAWKLTKDNWQKLAPLFVKFFRDGMGNTVATQEQLNKVKEWTEKTTRLIQDATDATNGK